MTAVDLTATREVLRRTWSPSRLEVALYGTPLLLLVNVRDDRLLTLAVAATILVVLTQRPLRESPWFWLGVALVIAVRQSGYFLILDDHVVGTTYWCLALGCALLAHDRERCLVRGAALLIGLIFAFAALWKVTSGQFVDARFFRFTLLWDPRFEHLDWLTGQADPSGSHQALRRLMISRSGTGTVVWPEGPRSSFVASVMTWWGLFIEAAVAVLFLVPLHRRPWLRDAGLMAFMVTTYAVVPIPGFGGLLAVMAAVHTDDMRWRRAYLVAFAVLLVVWPPIWRLLTGYDL